MRRHHSNEPYVKQFDKETGKLLNPITKENPYLTQDHNRQQRREKIRKYSGYQKRKQFITVFKEITTKPVKNAYGKVICDAITYYKPYQKTINHYANL
jgi:hypothetical protein